MSSPKKLELNITASRSMAKGIGLVSPESLSSSRELQVDYDVHWKDLQSSSRNVVSPETREPSKPSPNLKHRLATPRKNQTAQFPAHTKHAQDDVVKVVTPDKDSTASQIFKTPTTTEKPKQVVFTNPDVVHTRFIASPTTIFSPEEAKGSTSATSKVEFIPVPVPLPDDYEASKQAKYAERAKYGASSPRIENSPMRFFASASTPSARRYAPTMRFTPSRVEDIRPPFTPFSSATPPLRVAGSLAYETAHHMRYIPPQPGYHTTYQDDYKWYKGAYGESQKLISQKSDSTQTVKDVRPKQLASKKTPNVYPSKQAKHDAKILRRKSRLAEQNKPPKRTIPIMYQTEYMRAYGCPMR